MDADFLPFRSGSETATGGIGTIVAGVLLGVCCLVAFAVVAAWVSWLLTGTRVGFWPAVALGVVLLVVVLSGR